MKHLLGFLPIATSGLKWSQHKNRRFFFLKKESFMEMFSSLVMFYLVPVFLLNCFQETWATPSLIKTMIHGSVSNESLFQCKRPAHNSTRIELSFASFQYLSSFLSTLLWAFFGKLRDLVEGLEAASIKLCYDLFDDEASGPRSSTGDASRVQMSIPLEEIFAFKTCSCHVS